MKDKTVVVIGGGLAALSGAIRLAHLGFRVQLFEKNATLGGKMNQFQQDGFRFDTGPSLLTMPFIIDELFEMAGEKRSAHLDFIPIDPICRYFFNDFTVFNAWSDSGKMMEEIHAVFPEEASSYTSFMNYAERIYNTGAEVFLFTPLHEIRKLARPSLLKKILKLHRIDPLKTVHQAVTGFFSDQRLVQLFDRYATYNGSNPYTAPATLNIIPYVEFRLGGFYISGGMYRLVEALSKLALQSGVEIHTNTRVGKIRHLNSRVAGVSVNNEFIKADYILSGADVVETFSQLIDNFRKEAKKLEKLEPSLSGMVFLWGIDRQFPQLAHHNIFFSDDYRKEFAQIFNEKRVPDDPTVYISITSKTDSEHAPAGSENWFVLLNMPYLASAQNWEEEKNRMRNVILEKLYRHGLDVASHIVLEKVLTPEDFYHLYASNKGSIYGISSNSRLTAFRRPANRNRSIEGLYFAGGSAHPGGGIPLVLLSGKMAAELLADADKNENKNFKKSNLFNKNKSDFVKRENINSISMRRQTISIHQ